MSDGPRVVTFDGKLVIGLTGNIATGKTAVMRLAADRGALTIDADKIVHELMDRDANVQAAIAVAFGSGVRRPDGRIDRRALGEIVFNDPAALRDLEEMLHPMVRTAIAERITHSQAEVVLIEAIKLLEGELAHVCHRIWVTRCHRQRQLQRLMVCRGMDAESAAARVKMQSPQEEKIARADIVIDTDGLMSETESQFDMAWNRLPSPEKVQPASLVIGSAQPLGQATPRSAKPTTLKAILATAVKPAMERKWPADLQVRRAKPSDIPSILLLIQRATGSAPPLKRADLLMAFSERSYFIGQIGAEVQVVMGWSIDAQVARVDQMYLLPGKEAALTATAVLLEIEKSANTHIGEMIAAFLPSDGPAELPGLFAAEGYVGVAKEQLPESWQMAVDESQPPNTHLFIKVLRDERLQKS